MIEGSTPEGLMPGKKAPGAQKKQKPVELTTEETIKAIDEHFREVSKAKERDALLKSVAWDLAVSIAGEKYAYVMMGNSEVEKHLLDKADKVLSSVGIPFGAFPPYEQNKGSYTRAIAAKAEHILMEAYYKSQGGTLSSFKGDFDQLKQKAREYFSNKKPPSFKSSMEEDRYKQEYVEWVTDSLEKVHRESPYEDHGFFGGIWADWQSKKGAEEENKKRMGFRDKLEEAFFDKGEKGLLAQVMLSPMMKESVLAGILFGGAFPYMLLNIYSMYKSVQTNRKAVTPENPSTEKFGVTPEEVVKAFKESVLDDGRSNALVTAQKKKSRDLEAKKRGISGG